MPARGVAAVSAPSNQSGGRRGRASHPRDVAEPAPGPLPARHLTAARRAQSRNRPRRRPWRPPAPRPLLPAETYLAHAAASGMRGVGRRSPAHQREGATTARHTSRSGRLRPAVPRGARYRRHLQRGTTVAPLLLVETAPSAAAGSERLPPLRSDHEQQRAPA